MGASEPPASSSADELRVRASDRPPAPSPARSLADSDFVEALRSVGLVGELNEAEHDRIAALLQADTDDDTRRLDLLVTYYGASGDAVARKRRERADRFFWHSEESPTTVRTLIGRIRELAPELGNVEAVFAGPYDAPVLRLATASDYEDIVEEADESPSDPAEPSITVRAIVRAANAILARKRAERRFIPLMCDGERETYVGLSYEPASMLCAAELLEETDEDELKKLAGW